MQRKDGPRDLPLVPSQPSTGPGFLVRWKGRCGSTCTILTKRPFPFEVNVRLLFLN